ncbi:riboflavin synthase subunit alpha [Leuconostoc litchii]|uniref:Riboflavin synthase n=1 Tax=Leuconostoc litchii TaxID=1981069 RepID=A0A6P2CSA8_9LACO|nr:riboflavin synthase [Leuconostoc litchii]TYC47129.1 riboflavin synthase [Leuconostoc litchii]GMA69085.1 riboflavin synthase subunit alpha [Leuconostoc litchii]
MFTGITQEIGQIVSINKRNAKEINLRIIASKDYFLNSHIGDSVMVDGICLTIKYIHSNYADFDIMVPTFETTIVKYYQVGQKVNLEKALLVTNHFDGHFVLGHVDQTAKIIQKDHIEETTLLTFKLKNNQLMPQIVDKGSVTVSGVSLTVIQTQDNTFQVGLIPHTLMKTTLGLLEEHHLVNIETDILAKYLMKGQ